MELCLLQFHYIRKVQSRLDKVMGSTRENLDGVRVIRAFNKQEQEVARYNEENVTLEKVPAFCRKNFNINEPGNLYCD